ncbi:hypothetical protein CEXT_283871 [Caerostris extrusa]|uniref:Uncharacterized protein n=1 Tax=Caerostris extrusa TaxID=172846 RepID=A0AAV4XG73_CAEEX|nr:hypothetical protein CEXT_283871 [Caerostris extrusa]
MRINVAWRPLVKPMVRRLRHHGIRLNDPVHHQPSAGPAWVRIPFGLSPALHLISRLVWVAFVCRSTVFIGFVCRSTFVIGFVCRSTVVIGFVRRSTVIIDRKHKTPQNLTGMHDWKPGCPIIG